MRTSITVENKKKRDIPFWTIIIWLLIWQLGAMALDSPILLVSPIQVCITLFFLVQQADFWATIGFSFIRIAAGFLIAMVLGTVFAVISSKVRRFRELLALPVAVIKATPVASFIILVLIWISSRNLSIFISFLMAFPVIYTNVLTGIRELNPGLSEMAEVFSVPFGKRFRFIYLAQVLPYFASACNLALAMCWKAGVAAEIIGTPKGSIGEKLYYAKIYLETPELFAWTVVIIVVSIVFEKAFLWLMNLLVRKLQDMPENEKKVNITRTPTPASVKITHLSKSYNDKIVIADFTHTFLEGTVTCLMGKSGVGKTSLIRMIMGLEKKDAGEINIGGAEIAAVFQENRLCENLTAMVNLRFTTGKSHEEIKNLLIAMELTPDEIENKLVKQFSGGMKRRVAIARALLSESGIVIMDEPLKGLDKETRDNVICIMKEKLNGKTAVIVTHDVSEAELFGAEILRIGE